MIFPNQQPAIESTPKPQSPPPSQGKKKPRPKPVITDYASI